jgi:hypothetical protein
MTAVIDSVDIGGPSVVCRTLARRRLSESSIIASTATETNVVATLLSSHSRCQAQAQSYSEPLRQAANLVPSMTSVARGRIAVINPITR